ncbi:PUA-like domain-containing protein [Hygrophoropsis aurantiaca]|uniref:PUA-like domain-containing protein n=1 Tax=Hygrophoropsis aurantiaca TaxID=72124 RepID=A0ACB8AR03_9AGAM|nr:PUA-like domain-containing protein [Hygrophoropsis aurantiaca]
MGITVRVAMNPLNVFNGDIALDDLRELCSNSGVHRPLMAGIQGSKNDGCTSIVLSNLYADDKDFGNTIIYTGAGGRDNINHKTGKPNRVGPQVRDQKWTDWGNSALRLSRSTQKPVRVIRSHKVVSEYAPAEGYRYDGLYTVTDAWREKNDRDLIICRFRLERLPDQPPLPGDITPSSEIIEEFEAIEERKFSETELSDGSDSEEQKPIVKKRKRRSSDVNPAPSTRSAPVSRSNQPPSTSSRPASKAADADNAVSSSSHRRLKLDPDWFTPKAPSSFRKGK